MIDEEDGDLVAVGLQLGLGVRCLVGVQEDEVGAVGLALVDDVQGVAALRDEQVGGEVLLGEALEVDLAAVDRHVVDGHGKLDTVLQPLTVDEVLEVQGVQLAVVVVVGDLGELVLVQAGQHARPNHRKKQTHL